MTPARVTRQEAITRAAEIYLEARIRIEIDRAIAALEHQPTADIDEI